VMKTYYMPFQNPSALQIFLMASMAPLNSGLAPPIPTIWSFRRMTSNGWVNSREVAPAIPPHASCRKANSAPSKVLDGGKMCAFTVCQLSISSWITDRLTALVDVKVERHVRSYTDSGSPTSSTELLAAATMRKARLTRDPEFHLRFYRPSWSYQRYRAWHLESRSCAPSLVLSSRQWL
jgi:hypothetical protein